jgi:zinc-ribbon domain
MTAMNCTRCNTPLPPGSRFCPNCGQVIKTEAPQPPIANISQTNQPAIEGYPTVPMSPSQAQQPTQLSPLQPPYTSPPPAYQPTEAVSPGSLPSVGYRPPSPLLPARRRKNRLARTVLILVAVILVLVAIWFVGLRPYLHGLVQSQLDGVLSNTINQITPAEVALIPPGPRILPITETDANNVIVLNTAPSDPVQHIHMTITLAGLRLDFQAYGFANTITGVPQAINGQLVMTNVTVQGIASLLMSPDELTATLNAHLHDTGTKLHRYISGVLLKDHEIDLQLR